MNLFGDGQFIIHLVFGWHALKNEERRTKNEARVMRQLHCSQHAYLGYNVGLTFSETNRNSR